MIGSDLRSVAAGLRSQVAFLIGRARTTSAGAAAVRLTAAVAALVALMLAIPIDAHFESGSPASPLRLSLFAVPAAAGVGFFPRTRWVSLTALVAVAGWLVSTMVFEDAVGLGRVGLLAAALFVMHAASAMAAVLPYDCVVPPRILVRWVGRVGAVLGVGLVVGVGGMAVAGQLPSARSVVGPIVGSLVAAGLAGLLAWHLRRPRT